VAADQPTVTHETMTKLIETAIKYEYPENIVSVLARKDSGLLESAEGLGMPFVCHTKLLLNYLPDHQDNLNPILRKMISNNVVFCGTTAYNDLELININRYSDYIFVKNRFSVFSGKINNYI
jgi:molybdenum cofactor cytidylyltransferase